MNKQQATFLKHMTRATNHINAMNKQCTDVDANAVVQCVATNTAIFLHQYFAFQRTF
ncbi:hypothetical protein [Paracnuella aquatica]|uniref:hypothetical protein n=1 Tax=Paracnuella aquatica TaxID=2268757 RepID=UPI0012D81E4B|nr:hypothetical protein [Paracnuella aquatica]